MEDPHLKEWQEIRDRYKSQEPTEEIKFRIECIENLINNSLINEEYEHFR